jgi:hypothetical protein
MEYAIHQSKIVQIAIWIVALAVLSPFITPFHFRYFRYFRFYIIYVIFLS